MSARRKQETVLRLLRGEDLELLSRQLGVTAAELSGWREAFLAAGEVALKTRPADARDAEIGRLKEKVGDLTMANELLEAKIERLETARPLPAGGRGPPHATGRVGTPEAMSRRVSPSTDHIYGLQRVARIWGVSRAAVDRHRHQPEAVERRRHHHHRAGTTERAPPSGHHRAGTTERAPPSGHHRAGTTEPGTTERAHLKRYHQK